MSFSAADHPHRRYDPLADRWVLVSPHRALRPWLGMNEAARVAPAERHDASCYLCPGNVRATGTQNPDYRGPYVFDNDYPAILSDPTSSAPQHDPLLRSEGVRGEARVICYSPDHSKSLGQLDHEEIVAVVDCWCEQSAELGHRFANVQIFENKGEMMGASNPHPHGQIWATEHVPDVVKTEGLTQLLWYQTHNRSMLSTLAAQEAGGERSVIETEHWIAIVPYWAVWPFETLLLPRFSVARLPELSPAQRSDLASMLRHLLVRYNRLFECSFPYSMGWHGAPFTDEPSDHWLLHAHFYPPLLRSATIRKFMVGYEMLAEAQRDLTPEQAADRLRSVKI
jgi:UDPglucose--hexose-1-phosphate uridylyltransferase